jgi:hypothetical protein
VSTRSSSQEKSTNRLNCIILGDLKYKTQVCSHLNVTSAFPRPVSFHGQHSKYRVAGASDQWESASTSLRTDCIHGSHLWAEVRHPDFKACINFLCESSSSETNETHFALFFFSDHHLLCFLHIFAKSAYSHLRHGFLLPGPEPEDSKKSFITREEEPDQYAPETRT